MIWSKTVQSKLTKEGLNKSILQQSTSWLCHGGQATARLNSAELEHGSKELWTRREVFPGEDGRADSLGSARGAHRSLSSEGRRTRCCKGARSRQ